MNNILNPDIRLTRPPDIVKQAAVAGYFYPADPGELRDMLLKMLYTSIVKANAPKALIVPHAGYVYSGAIAATGYASLISVRDRIKRVIVLAPAHRVYLKGLAMSTASCFTTPLGRIKVDSQLKQCIKNFPQVTLMDEAFAQEHSIEVHLPFLQTVLNDFTLLPLVVGETPPGQVAEILESIWGGDETLIVISSDLSHFHNYPTARKLDAETARYITTMQYNNIGPEQACGYNPVRGLLKIAQQKGMQAKILDLRNSADTAGNPDRVVGYGAFTFDETLSLDQQDQQRLFDIAFDSIEYGLKYNKPYNPSLDRCSPALLEKCGLFVTLMLADNLRGCTGNTEAVYPLATGAAVSAFNAAFQDPRFNKLTASEFSAINLGISVLSPNIPILFDSDQSLLAQLIPGCDGLAIKRGNRFATFLPSVWEKLPDAKEFLAQLKNKAGIRPEQMPDAAWKYQSTSYYRDLPGKNIRPV